MRIKFVSIICFALISLLPSIHLFAQDTEISDGKEITSHKPFEGIEAFANFKDCTSKVASENKDCFLKILENHFKTTFEQPKDSASFVLKGNVYFNFNIDENGKYDSSEIFEERGTAAIFENLTTTLKSLPAMNGAIVDTLKAKTAFSAYLKFRSGQGYVLKIINIKLEKILPEYTGNDTFAIVEQKPMFVVCAQLKVGERSKQSCFNTKMNKHISKNFNFPKDAIALQIEGRINVFFRIDEEGKVTNVRAKGPHPVLELEAERIIRILPTFIPGKQRGKPIKVPYSIPINFRMQ